MRAIAALALYVSLAVSSYAGEWDNTRRKALLAFDREDLTTAATSLRASVQAAENKSQLANSEFELGVILYTSGKSREALPVLTDALSLFRSEAPDPVRAARAVETISIVRRNQGEYSTA